MTRRALVLFARAPHREAAAKRLPLQRAVPLFRSYIERWLAAAHAAGAMPVIACDERDREALAAIAPRFPREWHIQHGATFGTRVANASVETFRRYDAVIIAAIDAPPPDLAPVLASAAPVVAPSKDGGINFIALTRPEPELLLQFALRDRSLTRLCRAYFAHVIVLAPTQDIDTAEDLLGTSEIFFTTTLPQTSIAPTSAGRSPPVVR